MKDTIKRGKGNHFISKIQSKERAEAKQLEIVAETAESQEMIEPTQNVVEPIQEITPIVEEQQEKVEITEIAEDASNDNTLVEDTTTPNAPNIETTDEHLDPEKMFQEVLTPSLGRQIFSVVPMNGPTAALFNIRKKADSDDLELVRAEVEVFPSKSIKTGLTVEALMDIYKQYGKATPQLVGRLLRGVANDQENIKTLEFLNATALDAGVLTLSADVNAEVNLFEITQRVHELVLKINNKTSRSYKAFAVIPYKALGGLMGLSQYVGAEDKDERGLFIAEVGQTKFFLNPDANSTTAYVGIIDADSSKSSAVFSPYRATIVEAADADTGQKVYHLFNRFAITASPLHTGGNEMLYKFDIA